MKKVLAQRYTPRFELEHKSFGAAHHHHLKSNKQTDTNQTTKTKIQKFVRYMAGWLADLLANSS